MRIAFVVLLCAAASLAQTPTELDLMPMPSQVTVGAGELPITSSFTIAVQGEARLQRAGQRFLDQLARKTGIPIAQKIQKSGTATLTVTAEHSSKNYPQLGEDESYTMSVTAEGARISAPTTLGAMHGLQTFLQLVHPRKTSFVAQAVSIQDRPRFPWRGLMIDACRHWMPMEVIKRNLDGMAAAKLNVLHWHLSEDQGIRVESMKFPKLQQAASEGKFYTQAEIKDVVAYAADRGIRVVPEFDMPGHSSAWFVAYPELASGPGPYQVEHTFGVFDDAMDPTRESTYKFIDRFIGEISKLFPDAYWHIGGDEVKGTAWDSNSKIQQFMKAHSFTTHAQLQAYFNQRLLKILKKHHKRAIGWDEIFEPDLPKDTVVHSWRGPKSLAAAARAGYDGILSNGYYLDLVHPASDFYAVDPLGGDAASLTPEERARVQGGEACMWSELVDPENVDSRIWPTTAAVAERLWSPAELRDVASMYRRLDVFNRELDYVGVTVNRNYWPMLQRMAGDGDAAALKVLADLVEPSKGYTRHQTHNFTSDTPLNRLPDATRPDSAKARAFGDMVARIVGGQATPVERETARLWLSTWRDNDARLEPTLQQSYLLQEDAGISQSLSKVAEIGLEALNYLETRGSSAPGPAIDDTWRAQQMSVLTQAAKRQGELLLKIVAPVERLVQATK